MSNNVYIYLDVRALKVTRSARNLDPIPTGNQNYIYAKFIFDSSWDGLGKTAIFSKDGIDTRHMIIENDISQIPSEFMESPGIIKISVFAGNRRTVTTAEINVVKSGMMDVDPGEPSPGAIFVQTPDNSASFIRETDGTFQYFSNGIWNNVDDGKSPFIGDNGHWFEFEDNEWIDTGIKAQGIQGERGERGLQGVQGLKGDAGKDGINIDLIKVANEAQAISQSLLNPYGIYFWVV